MDAISVEIPFDQNLVNLKEINQVQMKSEMDNFLIPSELIIQCFETKRHQVIFTNKRVFVIESQGITGKRKSYFSYPYSKTVSFGVETVGPLDPNSNLFLTFVNGIRLKFGFASVVDIKDICANISNYVLTN